MNIIVKTKNFELTPSLRKFAEEKISSLKKYFDFFQTEDAPGLKSKIDAAIELGENHRGPTQGQHFPRRGFDNFSSQQTARRRERRRH